MSNRSWSALSFCFVVLVYAVTSRHEYRAGYEAGLVEARDLSLASRLAVRTLKDDKGAERLYIVALADDGKVLAKVGSWTDEPCVINKSSMTGCELNGSVEAAK